MSVTPDSIGNLWKAAIGHLYMSLERRPANAPASPLRALSHTLLAQVVGRRVDAADIDACAMGDTCRHRHAYCF